MLSCDCGGELIYTVDKVITGVQYKLKKDGKLYKNPFNRGNIAAKDGESYNFGRLECNDCDNIYEYNECLKTGKVLRGELL